MLRKVKKIKIKPKSELEIEIEILNWLNNIPKCKAVKIDTGGFFDTKRMVFRKKHHPYIQNGTHDIFFFIRGHGGTIEVKSKLGRVSENQEVFMAQIKYTDCFSMVARSLEEVQAAFIAFGLIEHLG